MNQELKVYMKIPRFTNDRNAVAASLNAVPTAVRRWDPDIQWFPALDITQTSEQYLIDVDMPGMQAEEIKVTTEGGIISIKGARPPHLRGGRNMRVERPSGPFIRRVALPDDAELDAMTTFCHNGVMELRIPRSQPNRASPEDVELAA